MRTYCIGLLCFSLPLLAEKPSRKQELDYYREEFTAQYRYPIYDTLFEKIVWERKVSHLVLEYKNGEHRVTLLMMDEYPWNYKAQNYPIYFAFQDFTAASNKFHELNHFLRNNGVMAVGLSGSRIVHERVLVPPVGKSPARPRLGDWPKGKEEDPILTRQPLPKRLPLHLTPR
ncbi:MAG: hypothetical protein N2Z22_08690 [Turneriella sp.]|nr:hypothetical protein [Turneriella sp.]